jgi:hypothetical protein
MSIAAKFCAIPPESSLYHRIDDCYEFNVLASLLYSFGTDIYRLFELPPYIVDEELQSLTEYLTDTEEFPTELSVQEAFAEYRSEIMLTRQNHPGIEDRYLVMHGASIEIQERLEPELIRKNVENAEEFLNNIFYGNQSIGNFEAMSRQLVSQAANILPQIDAEHLFSGNYGRDSVLLKYFEALRNFYLAVDANNEEIIVTYE